MIPNRDFARSRGNHCQATRQGGPAVLLRLPAVRDNAAMQAEPPKPTAETQTPLVSIQPADAVDLHGGRRDCVRLARSSDRTEAQRAKAVDTFLRYGGLVRFDYQPEEHSPDRIPPGVPNGPAWLRLLLGQNFFSDVEEVNFHPGFSQRGHGNDLDDEALANLESLPDLRFLSLFVTSKVTDAGLVHVARLKKLKYLCLYGTEANECGLGKLQGHDKS